MLRGEFESAAASPAALREAYTARVRETISTVGLETVVATSGVDRETVAALAAGESPDLTVETAAAILATEESMPSSAEIAAEARDMLLMGMASAVVDVDAVAAGIDLDLDPKEVQQKIEGRFPITLTEYAHVRAFLDRRQ